MNDNFEFIQFYISKDFMFCFGGECVEGRDEYIKSVNSVNSVIKDWTLTADVRHYGKKYLSLYTLRIITFLNGETFTIPAEASIGLNDDGSWKYFILSPNGQQYIDGFNAILERNSGVVKKEDL